MPVIQEAPQSSEGSSDLAPRSEVAARGGRGDWARRQPFKIVQEVDEALPIGRAAQGTGGRRLKGVKEVPELPARGFPRGRVASPGSKTPL